MKRIGMKFISGFISMIMMVNLIMPMGVYASVDTGDETVIEETVGEETTIEEGKEKPEEQLITTSGAETVGEEEETKEEESASEADKEEKVSNPFNESKTIGDVTITVKAEAGAFPEGSYLTVKEIVSNTDMSSDDETLAASYSYDITIYDKDDNEIEPAEGKNVSVSFSMDKIADSNLDTNIYHTSDDGTVTELDITTSGDTATVATDSFSVYTVEFTYGELTYVMNGDSTIKLSDILSSVGLTGEASSVECSDTSLFSASDESGEWIISSHRAFSTTEWMKVTIEDVVYEIKVTDAQSGNSHSWEGTENYTSAEIINMLGDSTFFGVVANDYDGCNNHSESNIAVKNITNVQDYTIGNSTQTYQQIGDYKITVNKVVKGVNKSGKFFFAVYQDPEGTRKFTSSDFSITTGSDGTGSYTFDYKHVAQNAARVYIFELDKEGGRPIKNGDKYGSYTVTYSANEIDGTNDSMVLYTDNFIENIGERNRDQIGRLIQRVDGATIYYKKSSSSYGCITYDHSARSGSSYIENTFNGEFPVDVGNLLSGAEGAAANIAKAKSNGSVEVANIIATNKGNLCEDLSRYYFGKNDQVYAVQTGFSVGSKLLVINVDLTNVSSYKFNKIKVNGSGTGDWSEISTQIVLNPVVKTDSGYAPYKGNLTVDFSSGTLIAPKCTITCTGSYGGTIIANKIIKRCEIHKMVIRKYLSQMASTTVTNTDPARIPVKLNVGKLVDGKTPAAEDVFSFTLKKYDDKNKGWQTLSSDLHNDFDRISYTIDDPQSLGMEYGTGNVYYFMFTENATTDTYVKDTSALLAKVEYEEGRGDAKIKGISYYRVSADEATKLEARFDKKYFKNEIRDNINFNNTTIQNFDISLTKFLNGNSLQDNSLKFDFWVRLVKTDANGTRTVEGGDRRKYPASMSSVTNNGSRIEYPVDVSAWGLERGKTYYYVFGEGSADASNTTQTVLDKAIVVVKVDYYVDGENIQKTYYRITDQATAEAILASPDSCAGIVDQCNDSTAVPEDKAGFYNKASVELEISDINPHVYDGTVYKPTVTVKDGSTTLTEGTHYILSYQKLSGTGIWTDVDVADVINVGTYQVVAKGMTGSAYELSTASKQFSITLKSLTITADSDTKEYDGTALTKDSFSKTDLASGDRIESVTITGSQTTYGESANEPSAAVIKNASDNDVTSNYDITYANGKLEITKRDVTVSVPDKTVTYNANEQKGNTAYNFTNIAEGDNATITYTPAKGTDASDTAYDNGSYADDFKVMSGSMDVTSSYNIKTKTTGKLTITKKALTITADSDSKTYDGTALTKDSYTSTDLATGDRIESVRVTGSQTVYGTGDNVPSSAVIKNASGDDVTASYDINYVKGKLEVTKKALTITADSDTKVYDGTALTKDGYTSTGLATGDRIESVTITGSQTVYGSSDNVASGAVIKNASGDDVTSSYDINYEKGKLEVTKKALMITADSDTKEYDGTALTKDSYTSTDLATGDRIESVTITGSQTTYGSCDNVASGAVIKNASSDDVTASYDITYANGTLEVTKKALTITADSDSKIYDGTALTKDSYTSTDLATGDRIESVTVTGSQTVYGIGDNVPSSAVIKNASGDDVTASYDITYANGKLEITKRDVTVSVADKTVTYNGNEQTGDTAYTFTNLVAGEVATITYTPAKGTDASVTAYDNASFADDFKVMSGSTDVTECYNLTTKTAGKLTINKAAITPTVTIKGWIAGKKPNAPTVTGNTGNGPVTIEYKKSDEADTAYTTVVPTTVGKYIVRATIVETTNYLGATATAEFKISAQPVVITDDDQEIKNDNDNAEGSSTPKESDYEIFMRQLREAAKKGTPQTLVLNWGNSLSYEALQILKDNPQLTLIFNYKWQGVDYSTTIGGGRTVYANKAVAWYGPDHLRGLYGASMGIAYANITEKAVTGTVNGVSNGVYVVQRGDNLWKIATLKLHVSVDYLVQKNRIVDRNRIRTGQVLYY